jgi:hypothetical protein
MYGLDSIRRFQAGGEAFSDDVVRDYIRSLADSSGNIRESDIAAAMSTFGVSPAQVARATGADPGYVSQQYSNYLAEPPPPPPPTPAAVDPVAQQYANDFNALINQGNYEGAARVVKEAELAGYGDEAYRAAAVALGAKANLPGGSDFIQPEGIQSIRDYVANVTNVDEFNKLIRDEEFGKAAAFAQSQGFTPDQVATYINENAANLGLSEGFGVTGENIATLYPGYVAPPPPAPVDPKVETFNSLIREGLFEEAGLLATEEGFSPEQVLPYLNDPNIFPEFGGGVTLDTVQSFVPEDKGIATVLPPPVDTGSGTPPVDTGSGTPPVDTGSGTGLGASEEFTNAVRGGYYYIAAQIAQNLGYNAQQAAEYINANAAALGLPENFAGVTGENLQSFFDGVNEKPINAGMDDFVRNTDPGNQAVVTDEAGNILSGPPDKVMPGIPKFARQTQSDLTFAPLRRGLAQLRTETYSPGLTSGQRALVGSGFTPEQLRQLTTKIVQEGEAAGRTQEQIVAEIEHLADIGGVSPAEAANVLGQSTKVMQDTYNQRRPGGIFATSAPTAPKPFALPEDFALQTGAYGAPTPTFFALPEKKTATSAAETPLPSGSTQNTDTGSEYTATDREGGLIKMAEGGGPPKMAELSAKEAGSTFDISKYIDDEGRLVGGYSKPIYDENRVITGYDYRPYERDVVFGKELRDKEAAMQLTDAEREQMMIEMAMRQGRTGVSPIRGGLAGIEIGDPMMRNRPQYYSTVEQFRPRYAEGGNVSSTAQDLASRGRGGDTMLVHMAPHEVAGLNALARMQGTELTINPETGMPEALKLGKLFKTLAPFIPFIPGVGQFLAPAFGALGMGGFSPLLQKAITSGVIGGFSGPKGGFDLQRGLMQGITAYGLGSLQQNLAGPSTPGGPPASGGPVNVDPSMGGVPPPMTGQNPLAGMEYINTTGQNPLAGIEYMNTTGINPLEGSQYINTIQTPGDITAASKAAEATRAGFPDQGVSDLGAPFEYQPVSPKNAATTASGMKTPTALLTTGLGVSSIAESDKLASAQMAAQREKEEEEDLYRRLFESTLGQVRTAKAGGLMKLAGGGMSYMEAGGTTGPTGAPRDVTGTGDGMSDSVPASIEGVQEARLADGEFVIPADVVADIGNGSSDAGSKKLYDMMDRVRKARHGTTEQPPEIQAERLMPA